MAAPTPLGIVTLTSGGGTITVPAGATGAVAFWGDYGCFSGMTTFTSSFATANTADRYQTPSIGGTHNGTGLWAFDVTATGSQTFSPTWSNAPIQGPALSIAFFKDLDAGWKGSGRFATNHNQYSTTGGSVTAETDAYILVFETQDGGTAPSVPSGRTLVQNRSENAIGGVFYYVNSPAAGSNTITSGNSNFPGIAIASIKGAAGGGATNYTLTCDVGSYSLTGIAALLRRGFSLVADVGSYALTGQDAALRRGYTLVADTGTYALTGQDAALRRGYNLVCDVGAYSLTGNDATLTYSAGGTAYTLTCDTGSYALTGYDANLVYTPGAANYALTADTGAYALTGNTAVLSLGRRMVADVGVYALTGQTASLIYGRRLVCDTGVYALSGGDADLVYTTTGPIAYSLKCDTGAYVLVGNDAALTYSAAQADNLTHAAKGLIPKIWPGLSIRYEGKPKQRVEQLEEEERERLEDIAEQAVIEAANERTKKAMKASLQASMRAAEIELAAKSYLHLVEQAALLRAEQIEEEDIAVALLLM